MKHLHLNLAHLCALGYINELMGFKNNIYMRIAASFTTEDAEQLFLKSDLNK